MLSKTVNGETTNFAYSNEQWQDQLTSVNGTLLEYDANGNVLTYGSKEYSWTNGRDLAQITDGDNTYSYTYDENGIRTSKTVNGVTTYYNTKDGVILSQTDGTNTMYFQYDSNGVPMGFIRNGVQYFYMTNQMGDVIGIKQKIVILGRLNNQPAFYCYKIFTYIDKFILFLGCLDSSISRVLLVLI
ncbi:MAG: hypothetical protein ACI4HO_02725 [Ruminococcus sp.]